MARHRGRVQEDGRRGQGRRAGLRRPLQEGDGRARGRPARRVLPRLQGAARRGDPPGPRERAADRAGQAAVPGRQDRRGRRRVHGRRRQGSALDATVAVSRRTRRLPPRSARSTRAASTPCWPSCRATRGSRSARRTSARRSRASTSRSPGALGGAAIENQLRQELGLDLQQDVFSWIGDIAVFARGTTAWHSIEGGVVIEVTDAAEGQVGVRQAARAGPEHAAACAPGRSRSTAPTPRSRPRCPARRSRSWPRAPTTGS